MDRRTNTINCPRCLDYRCTLPLDSAVSSSVGTSVALDGSPRDLVRSGRVRVNGGVETNCSRLVSRRDDEISVDGRSVQLVRPRYFVCYKPRGVVCSTKRVAGIDRTDSVLISEWLGGIRQSCREKMNLNAKELESMKTVGRLDEESEGLLLLTNDGSFSRLLCDPAFGLQKTYRVVARGSRYSRLLQVCGDGHRVDEDMNEQLKRHVVALVHNGNNAAGESAFPYESIAVLDVGKLPSQHNSDDSYYVLADLVLREGKRHAVRRIIKNSRLRVCYLARIKVEGVRHDVPKPGTLNEASGFFDTEGRSDPTRPSVQGELEKLLGIGQLHELTDDEVDRVFELRS
ncbi:hypothetical protein THAOC_14904 [Thalassiosira oceanica]|uniref:Pseudouridine synthase RsuA/RluA-like domain-containing protein n=1 Tax=Thalassiosira oceanica TaxID=159749 RepID=K0SG87_THAOC|nr:hypothetical protein THAOC_14904 [Thalassiosira oceanica]|eukprot:EJK64365.1 hypothetical protein THAOC_14904 [Thalassiosira oceanica]